MTATTNKKKQAKQSNFQWKRLNDSDYYIICRGEKKTTCSFVCDVVVVELSLSLFDHRYLQNINDHSIRIIYCFKPTQKKYHNKSIEKCVWIVMWFHADSFIKLSIFKLLPFVSYVCLFCSRFFFSFVSLPFQAKPSKMCLLPRMIAPSEMMIIFKKEINK